VERPMTSGARWKSSPATRMITSTSTERGSANWPCNWQRGRVWPFPRFTSDDGGVHELEVTLVSARHHNAIVIDRSQPDDHCQVTLERWLQSATNQTLTPSTVEPMNARLAACADVQLTHACV
jgi:hypothetical protein